MIILKETISGIVSEGDRFNICPLKTGWTVQYLLIINQFTLLNKSAPFISSVISAPTSEVGNFESFVHRLKSLLHKFDLYWL